MAKPQAVGHSGYDIGGRKVTELIKGFQTAGSHEAVFIARSQASGVYISRLQYGNKVFTQKMVLLK